VHCNACVVPHIMSILEFTTSHCFNLVYPQHGVVYYDGHCHPHIFGNCSCFVLASADFFFCRYCTCTTSVFCWRRNRLTTFSQFCSLLTVPSVILFVFLSCWLPLLIDHCAVPVPLCHCWYYTLALSPLLDTEL